MNLDHFTSHINAAILHNFIPYAQQIPALSNPGLKPFAHFPSANQSLQWFLEAYAFGQLEIETVYNPPRVVMYNLLLVCSSHFCVESWVVLLVDKLSFVQLFLSFLGVVLNKLLLLINWSALKFSLSEFLLVSLTISSPSST